MARVLLSAQQPSRAGVVPNFTAANASGGNNFANDGRTFIEVKNASASPINVTLNIPMTVDGNTVTAPVVVIPPPQVTKSSVHSRPQSSIRRTEP